MDLKLINKTQFDKVISTNTQNFTKLELFADMCRFNCLTAIKKAGSGHLGSSFSAMDIIVYLYLMELNYLSEGLNSKNRDIYFSSKGHDVPGLYSLFYALGYLDESKLLSLRRLDGLDGHPDISINGIEANTGSLGMGISKGKGFIFGKKYLNQKGRVFVLCGDGEFQEGQIYESLQTTAHQRANNITVIIDRNKFQTDRLVDNVNNIEDLSLKLLYFGWFVTSCNGHDYQEISSAINDTKRIQNKPKLIVAHTLKGKGVSFMETTSKMFNYEPLYEWHSGAPDDINFLAAACELEEKIIKKCEQLGIDKINFDVVHSTFKNGNGVKKEYIKNAFGEELCKIASLRKDIIVMDADLSADCSLREFENKYPERFIENGIAEQDMVSTAGGLAKMGLLPVVNSFASFLVSRANEQIYNNACEGTKIIYVCHFAGLIPAGPGKSHQSVRDISLLGALPNMTMIQPCNSQETKLALNYCVNKSKESVVLRLIIGPSPRIIKLPEKYTFEFGKGACLKEGNDAIIFAYGPTMLHEAMTASEILADMDFSLKVVNMPWLNRFDSQWLYEITEKFKNIFVLEDHSTFGGLGDRLLYELISIKDLSGVKFTKLGLDDYPACGTPQEVLQFHKLDGMSLAKTISGKSITEIEKQINIYSSEAPQ